MKVKIGVRILFSLIITIIGFEAYASEPEVNLVEEGSGYQVYSIISDVPNDRLSRSVPKDSDMFVPSGESNMTYVFDNLQAVYDSDLPNILKLQILASYDVSRSDDLEAYKLGPLVIDRNAALVAAQELMKMVNADTEKTRMSRGWIRDIGKKFDDWIHDVGSSIDDGVHDVVGSVFDVADNFGDALKAILKGECGGRWTNESHHKNIDIGVNAYEESYPQSTDAFSGNLSVRSGITGNADLILEYKLRKNACTLDFPYNFEFKNIQAKGKLNLDGTDFGLKGTLLDIKDMPILKSFPIFPKKSYDMDFWIGPVRVILPISFSADFSATLDAKVGVELGMKTLVSGDYSFHYYCELDFCENRTQDNPDLNTLSTDLETLYGVTVDAQVTPELDFALGTGLSLFTKKISVIDAEVHAVVSLPIRFWGYYGNTCGDANGDGENELVSAALLDVNAEIYTYYSYRWGFDDWKAVPIEIDLYVADGWFTKEDYYTEINLPGGSGEVKKEKAKYLYRKHLYFKDLISDGSSVLEPMIYGPDNIAMEDTGYIIKMRPCYPFKSPVEYEIDWGEGEYEIIKTSSTNTGITKHNWNYPGPHMLRATVLNDVDDDGDVQRSFDSQYTERDVMVSWDGKSTFYPGLLPAIISVIMN